MQAADVAAPGSRYRRFRLEQAEITSGAENLQTGAIAPVVLCSSLYLAAHGTPAGLAVIFQVTGLSRNVMTTGTNGWRRRRISFPTPQRAGGRRVQCRQRQCGGDPCVARVLVVLPTYAQGVVRDDLVTLGTWRRPIRSISGSPITPDAKKSRACARPSNRLTDAFDPRRHSWFRDEFVHPRKFVKQSR